MAGLEDPEKASSLGLLCLLCLLQRGAPMEPLFDILKKTDALNFEWLEVIRDLQSAEARVQELQVRSPGEYVVFSRSNQQIVARFNSLMAGASET
jgi:hypothetical protein